jgi:hypothetical protein
MCTRCEVLRTGVVPPATAASSSDGGADEASLGKGRGSPLGEDVALTPGETCASTSNADGQHRAEQPLTQPLFSEQVAKQQRTAQLVATTGGSQDEGVNPNSRNEEELEEDEVI